MAARRGEKIGWIGGWLGSFVWVLILALVIVFQGRIIAGISGLGLALVTFALVFIITPWHFPTTPYRYLLVPFYLLLAVCVAWALWATGSAQELGISPFSVFILLPLLSPLWIVGRRRWCDGPAGDNGQQQGGR